MTLSLLVKRKLRCGERNHDSFPKPMRFVSLLRQTPSPPAGSAAYSAGRARWSRRGLSASHGRSACGRSSAASGA